MLVTPIFLLLHYLRSSDKPEHVHRQADEEYIMGMAEYYAMKDAERPDGSVDMDQVPLRYGGNKNTGHPEDVEWRKDGGLRFVGQHP